METDFKIYPLKLDSKDYWGQVKRTVNGKPVSPKQIGLIVEAIERELHLGDRKLNNLLDIACGNGALSAMLFGHLLEFTGVDYSEFLISVAKRDFEARPRFSFELSDVMDYIKNDPCPDRINKVLCYGAFSYFPEAGEFLRTLYQRYTKVERVFIGNLPDKSRAHLFYRGKPPASSELIDHNSKIGVWRTETEFSDLARSAGWICRITRMPSDFYAGHYRYDALLIRGGI
jgi:SAM-dependent methyltransferase